MPALTDIAACLDTRLNTAAHGDIPTLWRASQRPVTRLGLALEPHAGLPVDGLDAVLLHRPFRLGEARWPGLGVLAVHGALDPELTTGWNPALAATLGLHDPQPLYRGGIRIGMTATLAAPLPWAVWVERLRFEFGGLDGDEGRGTALVRRTAVANAFTATLVEAALEAGADAYVTGEPRVPGVRAATATGLGTVYVGHRRSELWGLRQLARELEEAFPGLEARVIE